MAEQDPILLEHADESRDLRLKHLRTIQTHPALERTQIGQNRYGVGGKAGNAHARPESHDAKPQFCSNDPEGRIHYAGRHSDGRNRRSRRVSIRQIHISPAQFEEMRADYGRARNQNQTYSVFQCPTA